MKKLAIPFAAVAALTLGGQALAADHQVKMLNSGADGIMTFEPGFVKAAPGDTVTFIAADMSHDSTAVFGPEGADLWQGPLNENFTVTLNEEGVYIYKCTPHLALGMVGVIQVGEAQNLEAAQKAAADLKATMATNKDRLDNYLSQAN